MPRALQVIGAAGGSQDAADFDARHGNVYQLNNGRYPEDCRDLDYSRRVVAAYMQRYCPQAWRDADVETIARIHNGGPAGAYNPKTIAYAERVKRALAPAPKKVPKKSAGKPKARRTRRT